MKPRLLCLFCLLCSLSFAQAAKPAETPAPSATLTAEQKVSVLSAQHALDTVNGKLQALDAQFSQMQTQARSQFQQLQAEQTKAQGVVDKAKESAFTAAKLDPAKFDLDLDTMTFKAKPAEAPKPKAAKASAPK